MCLPGIRRWYDSSKSAKIDRKAAEKSNDDVRLTLGLIWEIDLKVRKAKKAYSRKWAILSKPIIRICGVDRFGMDEIAIIAAAYRIAGR